MKSYAFVLVCRFFLELQLVKFRIRAAPREQFFVPSPDADKRVPITQAQEFHWSLKSAGIETELVIYPRQKHGFHERAHQLDLANRVCDWFARFIPVG